MRLSAGVVCCSADTSVCSGATISSCIPAWLHELVENVRLKAPVGLEALDSMYQRNKVQAGTVPWCKGRSNVSFSG